MERIKQALERAKEQRTVVDGAPPVRGRPTETARDAAALHIDYTQTRVFQPDVQVLKERRVIAGRDDDQITDAYRMLRTRVLRAMADNKWNSLAVTSPAQGEGKTLTAINLGLSMAREVDRTVLLVDIDLRRPGVHQYFGLEPARGLSDFLVDDVSLSEVLVNPGIERFVILPGRGRREDSSELLGSPRMEALATEIRQRYPDRIVIYDLPPVLAVDDALVFAPHVDAFLLVVEEGASRAEDIVAAHEVLNDCTIVGTVLNKAGDSGSAREYY